MNFAAQIFYSSYLSERLERLYSSRPALKDSEENDPFWQRWEAPDPNRPVGTHSASLCSLFKLRRPSVQVVPPP